MVMSNVAIFPMLMNGRPAEQVGWGWRIGALNLGSPCRMLNFKCGHVSCCYISNVNEWEAC